jgi:hypothetical protein
MRNLRNRVSAFALALVLASGMVGMFNAPVRAFDGTSAPTVDDACASLAAAAENVKNLPAPAARVLAALIAAAQKALGC